MDNSERTAPEERVLITISATEDGETLRSILEEAGLRSAICETVPDLCAGIKSGAALAILGEAFLTPSSEELLGQTLRQQPEWSDFPLIVMATRGDTPHRVWNLLSEAGVRVQAILLPRPAWRATLLGAVRAAFRSRTRQYQVRDELLHRSRLEAAHRESEARYRQVVQAMPVAVYATDASGRITLFNEAAACLWGREPVLWADLWCGSWKIFRLDGTPLTLNESPMAVALRSHRVINGEELFVERPDGTRSNVLHYPVVLFDESGKLVGAVNILVDITERRRVEVALKEANRRKDEFLATLAHELRNPLAPLSNAVDLLRINQSNSPWQDEICGMMERQVRDLTRLVDELLDVARLARGRIELRMERGDLAAIVKNAIETTNPLLHVRKQRLKLSSTQDPILIYADSLRIAQVVANLLNNASKYSDEGGEITLSVSKNVSSAVVSVRDTGIGIPPEMLETVFELFTRVDQSLVRTQGGLGIGLTLARSIVEMHGGFLEARSEGIGHGSEFVVSLPLADSLPALPPNMENAHSDILRKRRVLVIDDTRAAAVLMGRLLEALGQEVEICSDARTAVSTALSIRPDIIFSDIAMPHVDGYKLACQLRAEERLQHTILIALTGFGQHSDRQRALDAGFHHHLVKPVSISMLKELLRGI